MASNPIIGILGGGQLGRMLQEQAAMLGIELAVLDEEGCPARQINCSKRNVTGSYKDPDKIRELARRCDILTVEIEHIDTEILEEVATIGVDMGGGRRKKVPVHPSWETLRLLQDKFLQKEHFKLHGLPVAAQMMIDTGVSMLDSLEEAARQFDYPFMLKSRKGSYDGRGNLQVEEPEHFSDAVRLMGQVPLYAEEFLTFHSELAVIVVRTEDDNGDQEHLYSYPAVETVHRDSVCSTVFFPPRKIGADVCERARKLAHEVVATLNGRGVFAVEMFCYSSTNRLMVNEVAPRPHNSGHLTIEALPSMSQFKAHLYSILGRIPPLLELRPRVRSAIMVNIMGGMTTNSHQSLVKLAEGMRDDDMDIFLHLYGKSSKPGRKIGHITVTCRQGSESNIEKFAGPLIEEAERIRWDRIQNTQEIFRREMAMAPSQPSTGSSRDVTNPWVMVTMGSDSDLGVLQGAFEILERFRVPYDFTITSAHRTPNRVCELARSAADRGIRVLIAAAGGAAALPGMLASETTVPTIGVPVKATHLDGYDSLVSLSQLPRGCPVATVGINNSTNAALLAVRILGVSDADYRQAMADYMKEMASEVERKAALLQELGWKSYLEERR